MHAPQRARKERGQRIYEKSIELRNRAVADELSAVHQYMYFHFHCDDQGYDLLAGLFKRTAIEEMLHIERIAERVLYLKGDVALNASADVERRHEVREMPEMARGMEEQSIKDYNQCALECASSADSVSRKLFEDLVADEERHFGQYDAQPDNLERFGGQYLALQSMERSRGGGPETPRA